LYSDLTDDLDDDDDASNVDGALVSHHKLAMMPLPHHLDGLASHQKLAKSGDVELLHHGVGTTDDAAPATDAEVEAATIRFACMKGTALGLVAVREMNRRRVLKGKRKRETKE
jgi:hypothetical protein